jgi:hypothetical protein
MVSSLKTTREGYLIYFLLPKYFDLLTGHYKGCVRNINVNLSPLVCLEAAVFFCGLFVLLFGFESNLSNQINKNYSMG